MCIVCDVVMQNSEELICSATCSDIWDLEAQLRSELDYELEEC